MRTVFLLLAVFAVAASAVEIVAGEQQQPSSDPFCGS